jgi:hypothetical protein
MTTNPTELELALQFAQLILLALQIALLADEISRK